MYVDKWFIAPIFFAEPNQNQDLRREKTIKIIFDLYCCWLYFAATNYKY